MASSKGDVIFIGNQRIIPQRHEDLIEVFLMKDQPDSEMMPL